MTPDVTSWPAPMRMNCSDPGAPFVCCWLNAASAKLPLWHERDLVEDVSSYRLAFCDLVSVAFGLESSERYERSESWVHVVPSAGHHDHTHHQSEHCTSHERSPPSTRTASLHEFDPARRFALSVRDESLGCWECSAAEGRVVWGRYDRRREGSS